MKKVNGMTVYEEEDKCSLDEYSEQIANDLQVKFDNKAIKTQEMNIETTEEITSYNIENVEEIYMYGYLLTENKHYIKTDTTVSFLFTVPSGTDITFKVGGGTSEN